MLIKSVRQHHRHRWWRRLGLHREVWPEFDQIIDEVKRLGMEKMGCNHCTGWMWAEKAATHGVPIIKGTDAYLSYPKRSAQGKGSHAFLGNGDSVTSVAAAGHGVRRKLGFSQRPPLLIKRQRNFPVDPRDLDPMPQGRAHRALKVAAAAWVSVASDDMSAGRVMRVPVTMSGSADLERRRVDLRDPRFGELARRHHLFDRRAGFAVLRETGEQERD